MVQIHADFRMVIIHIPDGLILTAALCVQNANLIPVSKREQRLVIGCNKADALLCLLQVVVKPITAVAITVNVIVTFGGIQAQQVGIVRRVHPDAELLGVIARKAAFGMSGTEGRKRRTTFQYAPAGDIRFLLPVRTAREIDHPIGDFLDAAIRSPPGKRGIILFRIRMCRKICRIGNRNTQGAVLQAENLFLCSILKLKEIMLADFCTVFIHIAAAFSEEIKDGIDFVLECV